MSGNFLSNFILGVLGLAGSVVIIVNAYYIQHRLMPANWFEQKFGPGTGTLFYRLVGLALSLFFLFVMLNIINLAGIISGTPGAVTDQRSPNQNSSSPTLTPGSGGNRFAQ